MDKRELFLAIVYDILDQASVKIYVVVIVAFVIQPSQRSFKILQTFIDHVQIGNWHTAAASLRSSGHVPLQMAIEQPFVLAFRIRHLSDDLIPQRTQRIRPRRRIHGMWRCHVGGSKG